MSRRIDIELTSSRDAGTWTWRAAGAKQPKGTLAGDLLPEGASVGDQMRAEVETSIDGTDVLAVMPAKQRKEKPVETIELIARGPSDDELVITTLAKGARGGRRDRDDRGPRRDGDRRPRRDGDRNRDDRGRGDRSSRGPRGEGGARGAGDRRDRSDRPARPRRERPAPPPTPKAKRLRPARTHRKAALNVLSPEEQVIAEQLLKGGIPGVRQAVEKQNAQAKAEGRPTVNPDALLTVAERLLPALRTAEWRDRAEAAVADLEELDLRDLRSVVVAAETGAKDDEARELAAQLREGLTLRVEQEQTRWLTELTDTLAEGRVVRALRLSSRPPKAGAPLPAELAGKLAEAASASLTADTATDRWATVLDALSFSPVRLTVAPASKPETPSEDLVAAITRAASRVPKVAEAFGIEAPAEKPRRRSRSEGKPKRKGPKQGGGDQKAAKPVSGQESAEATAAAPPAGKPSAPTEPSTEAPSAPEADATPEAQAIEPRATEAEPAAAAPSTEDDHAS